MLKNIILSMFIFIYSFTIGADIPNEQITKNPKKEVTTVISPKKRDHANMSITVNKINIIDLKGTNNSNGEIEFKLTAENIFDKNTEEIKIIKHIDKNIKQGRNKRAFIFEKESNKEIPFTLENNEKETIIKIKQEEATEQIYILKLDKNNKIKKVYAGKEYSTSKITSRNLFSSPKYLGVLANGRGQGNITNTEYILGGKANNKSMLFNSTSGIKLSAVSDGYDKKRNTYSRVDNQYSFIAEDSLYFEILVNTSHNSIKVHGNLKGEKSGMTGQYPAEIRCISGLFGTSPNEDGILEEYAVYGKKYINIVETDTYDNNGGAYVNSSSDDSNVSVHTVFGGETRSWSGKFPKEATVLVMARENKIKNLAIYEREFEKVEKGYGFISYETLGLTSEMGYVQKDRNKYKDNINYVYKIIDNKYGDKLALTEDGIYISDALSSGQYQIKVKVDIEINGDDIYTMVQEDTININLIKADQNIQIGERTFYMDNRLKERALGHNKPYVTTTAHVRRILNGIHSNCYSELLRMEDGLKVDGISSRIVQVKAIEGRSFYNEFNGHSVFTAPIGWPDESAIPLRIPLSELNEKATVSVNNSGDPEMYNNRFTLICEDNVSYSGNIKEVYNDNTTNNASAELDMRDGEVNTGGVWEDNISGEVVNNHYNLKITSGKLFNNKGIHDNNKSIVTHLIVTEEGKESISASGNLNSDTGKTNGDYLQVNTGDNIVGIDGTGRLYIKKLNYNPKERILRIETRYQDVSLGTLTLKIVNGYELSLIGDDVIDFGEIIQGTEVTKSALMQMKNPGRYKVDIKVAESSKNSEMTLVGGTDTVPLKNTRVIFKPSSTEQEIENFLLETTAVAPRDVSTGAYEGELEVVVTIFPKKIVKRW